MKVGERIADMRKRMGLSQTQLAENARLSQGTIAKLEKGFSSGSSHLHRIAAALQTSAAYLSGETDDDSPEFMPPPSQKMVAQEMGLVRMREINPDLGLGGATVDQAPAGKAHYFPREWLDYYTDAASDHLVLMRARSDNMAPTILQNDLVLIDTSETVPRELDRCWAINYCGLGGIKRLRRIGERQWLLMSDNPAILPIEVYDNELHIFGRVCAYFRKQ